MMKTPSWFDKGKNHIWYPYTQMQRMSSPLLVENTEGCLITLSDGRQLIDGIASWWSVCHGYNHPYILEKMHQQLEKMPHVMFAGVAHQQAYELATRLAKLTGLERVFFTDSGSTSVETAMKMAVQYWHNQGKKHRNKFLCFRHGYHGDTMGCMSLCDPEKGMHKAFNHYMPKQYNAALPMDEYSFYEFDALLHNIKESVAGVIIEPLVQGAGGMKFHTADLLAEIYRLCKKHHILFIADEIMTGFGRTGALFACDEAAITPDIMCVGKALTGGNITLAAVLAREYIFESFCGDSLDQALMCGPTFMANPLACAAANASLDLFESSDYLKQIENIEKQLYEQLQKCKRLERVTEVRVKGAIGVVEFQTNWQELFALRQKAVEMGVWVRPFGNVMYLMPAFTITSNQLETLTNVIYSLLKDELSNPN